MIGAIKIKDGLFIGDEFAAQVIYLSFIIFIGLRIRHGKQGQSRDQLCWKAGPKPLGGHWSSLPQIQLG
jgi:hypothetical protein